MPLCATFYFVPDTSRISQTFFGERTWKRGLLLCKNFQMWSFKYSNTCSGSTSFNDTKEFCPRTFWENIGFLLKWGSLKIPCLIYSINLESTVIDIFFITTKWLPNNYIKMSTVLQYRVHNFGEAFHWEKTKVPIHIMMSFKDLIPILTDRGADIMICKMWI